MEGALEKTLQSDRHKALIDTLVKQRKSVGMSQQELANAIDEYQSYIARLESGQRRLDVIEFIRMCSFLELDPISVIQDLLVIPE